MVRIIGIEDAGPDKKARRLVFDDEDEPIVTSAAVVRVVGLALGDEVARPDLRARLAPVEADCARERTLALLGYRDRTSYELHTRLVKEGYPDHVVRDVVVRFEELGYVDDRRYIVQYSGVRTAAGYGPSRIERELRSKGIDPELTREVLGPADDEALVQRARALVARIDTSDRRGRERAFGRLIRKGFSSRTASRALDSDDVDDL